MSQPIDEPSILIPSTIFGQRKEVDFQTLDARADTIAQKTFSQIKYATSEEMSTLILNESEGNTTLSRLVIDKLLQTDLSTETKEYLLLAREEIHSIFEEKLCNTLEYISPKTVSENEGDLPVVPSHHREIITDYLRENITELEAVQRLGLNRQTARNVLNSIKVIDLEIDRLSLDEKTALRFTIPSYTLRTLCLQASDAQMNTYEAYTKSINPKHFENQFTPEAKEYACHEYNYIPERVALHLKVLHGYGIEMMSLSKRLNMPYRTFYAIAGNTAVGKSHCTKTDPDFQKALKDGEMAGALCLDTVKGNLRKDVEKVTNQQVHLEGLVIAQKLALELENKALRASVIVDERLGVRQNVETLLHVAEQTGAKVRYKDIDGPLLLSCLRVLGRNIKTEPCIPLGPIANGQRSSRRGRKDVLDMAKSLPTIEKYQLFVANERGQQKLVAEKTDSSLSIYDENLFNESQREISEDEVHSIRTTKIDKTFIENALHLIGVNTNSLKKYEGKTIEQALEDHSKELP